MTFTYNFAYGGDTVYFAYCYPYTYTELRNYCNKLSESYPSFLRVDPLCKTLSGNTCDILTITNNIQSYKTYKEEIYERSVSEAARRLLRLK